MIIQNIEVNMLSFFKTILTNKSESNACLALSYSFMFNSNNTQRQNSYLSNINIRG